MPRVDKDETREHRIAMEAIVDAYGAEEQAMGWYYYLDDRLVSPSLPNASPGGRYLPSG